MDDDRSVIYLKKGLEIYTMKNIEGLIQINIMFLKMTI